MVKEIVSPAARSEFMSTRGIMGRPKMCGNKISCKLRDAHDGDCDFGLEKKDSPSEVEELKKQITQLQGQLAKASPEALTARTATAELALARAHASIRDMASGCSAAGMTILAAQLTNLLPKEEEKDGTT